MISTYEHLIFFRYISVCSYEQVLEFSMNFEISIHCKSKLNKYFIFKIESPPIWRQFSIDFPSSWAPLTTGHLPTDSVLTRYLHLNVQEITKYLRESKKRNIFFLKSVVLTLTLIWARLFKQISTLKGVFFWTDTLKVFPYINNFNLKMHIIHFPWI